MFKRIIPLLILLSYINAQIALPTFQAVHKPHTISSSSGQYTFTNCGVVGKDGPSQSDCNTEYSGTSLDGNLTLSGGIQTWTVPATASYTIEVWGASGGANYADEPGGKGARMKGTFSLNQDEVLKILVGHMGGDITTSQSNYGGGGGGGTFVAKSDNTALIVSGGGGGAAKTLTSNSDAVTTTSGISGGGGGGTGGSGGSGGLKGNGAPAGGAGYTGDGQLGSSWGGLSSAPKSFINGGSGQDKAAANGYGGIGGFGGGAAGHGPGGGGGGYSGGGGGNACCGSNTSGGGGGGSYNSGDNQDNSAGVWESHGKVIITY